MAATTLVLESGTGRSFGRTTPNQSVESQAQRQSMSTPSELPGARAEVYKSIGDVDLRIHIFEPEGPQPAHGRPAIVFFFGGGWRGGVPTQFAPHCRYLASRGMVAMTADYRVLSRHGTRAVTCVEDAKSAIRWIRQNANRLGIDPNRLAAGGGSAGGHLAASAGVLPEFDAPTEDFSVSSVPNAMILFNPATVLAPVGDQLPLAQDRMAGLAERLGVEPRKLSPYHHVREGLPPTMIHHGTDDPTVPFLTARLFADAMKEAGNRCELVAYEGERHWFFNWGRNNNKNFIQTMQNTDKFLRSLGYVEGQDSVVAFTKSAASQVEE